MNWEAVCKNKLFQGIDLDHLERMLECSMSRYRTYCRGESVFSQEEKASSLYVLLKGRVVLVKQLISGRKNILYEVSENDIFGEHYIFCDDSVYRYGAQAVTDVEVLQIPCSFFYGFCSETCDHHRKLIRNMLEILSAKEWMSVRKMNIISATSLKERISIWLMDEAREDGVVQLKMNREELADYIGVARPSLSRALMKMQNEGMIEVDRTHIKILDIEKLENFCN